MSGSLVGLLALFWISINWIQATIRYRLFLVLSFCSPNFRFWISPTIQLLPYLLIHP